MHSRLLFCVEPMSLADIDQVMSIEHASFSAPWSPNAYRHEVTSNQHSTMLVVRPTPRWSSPVGKVLGRLVGTQPGPMLGYGGAWHLVDEIHVSTIAVHPQWRRRGLGELLLLALLDRGAALKVTRATLEVRISNKAALELYRKYGFEIVSQQKAYYSDNAEDAYIMATPNFGSAVFQANLGRCRAELYARLETDDAVHGGWARAGGQAGHKIGA